MFGGNLPENNEFTLSLLTNAEYLKMNQHSFGAREILRKESDSKGEIIWAAEGKNCKYVALFNTDTSPKTIKTDLDGEYTALNIWSGESSAVKNTLEAVVEPHGAALYKLYK